VAKKLPIMLAVSKEFPGYRFAVAKTSSLDEDFYTQFLKNYPDVSSVKDQTYSLLSQATAALVTSGTATLETALFGVPQVVCYKGSAVSYQIAKRLISIKYISLVNLIMDKPVVKELIQNELTISNLVLELQSILQNENKRRQILNDYRALQEMLQKQGNASARAAEEIIGFLQASV
jgi:lipid-A-disaccharide synthase